MAHGVSTASFPKDMDFFPHAIIRWWYIIGNAKAAYAAGLHSWIAFAAEFSQPTRSDTRSRYDHGHRLPGRQQETLLKVADVQRLWGANEAQLMKPHSIRHRPTPQARPCSPDGDGTWNLGQLSLSTLF